MSRLAVEKTVPRRELPRRRWLAQVGAGLGLAGLLSGSSSADHLPAEPVDIGHQPVFLFDLHAVDNTWAVRRKGPPVELISHAATKHAANPLLHGSLYGGYVYVLRDSEASWRMYYQASDAEAAARGTPSTGTAIAHSQDGFQWTTPELGQFEFAGTRKNNIVWMGSRVRAAGTQILELPDEDHRGFRYVMLTRSGAGLELVGSQDGVHWDPHSVQVIAPRLHSDTYNTIVFDSQRRQYVWFGRAKQGGGLAYRGGGSSEQWLIGGATRRIARMASPELWTEWESSPQTVLVPDALDAQEGFSYFYGMPVRYHAGVYWGFLWPFRLNTQIYTELVASRDGQHWHRPPLRTRLIELGSPGSWDSGMIFAGPSWVEVGDEWWIYYAGWDGPHESDTRTPGIGLATLRKEGFYSLHGPAGGGVVATRALRWPSGPLLVNANATQGELRVRVTDATRQAIPGFEYEQCEAFHGDAVRHTVSWQGRSMAELAGQTVRLDFYLRNADLYSFLAGPKPANSP